MRLRALHGVILAVSLLVACSSSGGDGWPFEVRPVDEQARSRAMAAIATRCDQVAAGSTDRAAQNQAIADYLKTVPEIAIAAPSADGVVAYFYDAQAIIILNNTLLGDGSKGSPLLQNPPGQGDLGQQQLPLSRSPMAAGGPTDLPASKLARLGSGFPDNSASMQFPADPTADLAKALQKGGYLTTTISPTVSNLRTVGGDGVFHLRTHGGGGCFDKRGGPCQPSFDPNNELDPTQRANWPQVLYGLWTVDADNESSRATQQEDLKDGSLVHMYEATGIWSHDWHLGITGKFVTKHWGSFARNAYVHISGCSGTSLDAKDNFIPAMKAKGAITYFGWSTLTVVSDMDRAATFMVDRLTGANELDPKEDPPQRPFDYTAVLEDMKGRGMTTSGTYGSLLGLANPAFAFGLLNPSIASVASGGGYLLVTGIFGNDKTNAKVTVGGDDCAIKDWTSANVTCKLSDGSKGDVVVTVNDHESNHVKLSSWKGDLTNTFLSAPAGLSLVWTLSLHLRGDIHDYREKPGQAPVQHKTTVEIVPDSKGSVAVDGIATATDGYSVDWGKASATLGVGEGVGPNFYGGQAIVDQGDAAHLWFELRGVTQTDLCHEVIRDSKGNVVADAKRGFIMPWFEVSNGGVLYARIKNAAGLSGTGTISAGGVGPVASQPAVSGVKLDWSQSVDWKTITPEAGTAPDPKQDQH
jgi:hypothetical protein